MSDARDEARSLLEAASPLPWEVTDDGLAVELPMRRRIASNCATRADAELIAAAPRLLAALVAQVDAAEARPHLFVEQDFISHAGLPLRWKVECDALTDADLATLALMASENLPSFSSVEGVPTGGRRFADALRPYASDEGAVLIADDVLTTGGSMEEQRAGRPDTIGVVIFARGACPSWVTPLFTLGTAVVAAEVRAREAEARVEELTTTNRRLRGWADERTPLELLWPEAEVDSDETWANPRVAASDLREYTNFISRIAIDDQDAALLVAVVELLDRLADRREAALAAVSTVGAGPVSNESHAAPSETHAVGAVDEPTEAPSRTIHVDVPADDGSSIGYEIPRKSLSQRITQDRIAAAAAVPVADTPTPTWTALGATPHPYRRDLYEWPDGSAAYAVHSGGWVVVIYRPGESAWVELCPTEAAALRFVADLQAFTPTTEETT